MLKRRVFTDPKHDVTLICRRCYTVSLVNAALAVVRGWPRCCGETMGMEVAR